jgi:GWxTD domain-containing protein
MLKSVFLFFFFTAASLTGWSQSIAGLNLRYLYDPQNDIDLSMKLVNDKSRLTLHYRLLQNGTDAPESYTIAWLRYESITQKEGTVLAAGDSTALAGKLTYPVPEKPWFLVAKVTSKASAKTWSYVQVMESKYPVNGFLEGPEGIVFKPYAILGQEYALRGTGSDQTLHVFYYKPDFTVASPPFTEKGAHVDRFMFADSSFNLPQGQKILLKSKGLYLVQQDTTSAEGFAFQAFNASYPKLTKIEDIPGPLIFVCAKEEHDELLAAGNDKAKVDKVILDITRDKDRAKNFMRSYFRRVELANLYFSSYKEGWKTDRGMIYLIFGLPDEVNRTGPNEVWYYKTYKERFTFVKNGSVYDPNNYILVRSSKLAELWFNTVDLWRKSRF